jgi:hypothetical protein
MTTDLQRPHFNAQLDGSAYLERQGLAMTMTQEEARPAAERPDSEGVGVVWRRDLAVLVLNRHREGRGHRCTVCATAWPCGFVKIARHIVDH